MRDSFRLIPVSALLAAAILTCTADNPATCRNDDECHGAFRCDKTEGSATRFTCVPGDTGGKDASVDATTGPDVPVAACAGSSACLDPAMPICDLGASSGGECVPCKSGDECMLRDPAAAFCDTGTGKCVACITHSDCKDPAAAVCAANVCVACGAPGASTTGCKDRDATLPFCEAGSGKCVGCLAHVDCTDPTMPACSANACVGCGNVSAATNACAMRDPATPACDKETGKCVACVVHADCKQPGAPLCVENACVPCGASSAASVADCSSRDPNSPFCDAGTGECVACLKHTDCKDTTPICNPQGICVKCDGSAASAAVCRSRNSSKPICNQAAGYCAECYESSDCPDPYKSICRNDVCAACKSDSECEARGGAEPGLCLYHQNKARCATEAETLYVDKTNPSCAPASSPGGTATTPFCEIQPAIDAATNNRPLIAVRGGINLAGFFANPAVSPNLAVIAKVPVKITPKSGNGITVNGSELFVRGITISGAPAYGILVNGTGSIRTDRVRVENAGSAGVGLLANAAFDLRNTIISGCKFGVSIEQTRLGGPSLITHMTVANNKMEGIYCDIGATIPNDIAVTALLSYGNGAAAPWGVTETCIFSICCRNGNTPADPRFTSDFHLTSGSPCIDTEDPNPYYWYDFDGEARPQGAKADCGADEFKP